MTVAGPLDGSMFSAFEQQQWSQFGWRGVRRGES